MKAVLADLMKENKAALSLSVNINGISVPQPGCFDGILGQGSIFIHIHTFILIRPDNKEPENAGIENFDEKDETTCQGRKVENECE